MSSDRPLVFVSCGQFSENEKKLGKDICLLLERLRPDVATYFAEAQSNAQGLSDNILKALHRAAGFICVMHERGMIATPDAKTVTRGSVWVEQEIAITAFIIHVLNRPVPILFYKQAGVNLEGIRSVLLLNPRVEFTEESQVLQDLMAVLPSADFTPFSAYDVVPVITYKRSNPSGDGDHHDYVLTADVKNVGTQRVTDFKLRVLLPRLFLNSYTNWAGIEEKARSSPSHLCFTVDAGERAPSGLYPGDTLTNPLRIDYFVDHDLDDDPNAMLSEVRVELFSGSVASKQQTIQMKDLQEF